MISVLINYPVFRAEDENGAPLAGGLVWTMPVGSITYTAQVTYSDRLLTVPNTTPIILNDRGECVIYTGQAVKLVLTVAGGDPSSPIWTMDYLGGSSSPYIIPATVVGTTNNNYELTATPAPLSMNEVNMIVWYPDADSIETIGTQTFSGSGGEDGVFSGPYLGTTAGSVFEVVIDGIATPSVPADTFKWRKDGEAWVTGVSITADPVLPQILKENVSITFSSSVGHGQGDQTTVTVMTPVRVNLNDLGNYLVVKNVGGELQALAGNDLRQDYPAVLVWSPNQSVYELINPQIYALERLVPRLVRKQVQANYTVIPSDWGKEISCEASSGIAISLASCHTMIWRYLWIKNISPYDVTVNAYGAELIWDQNSSSGAGSITVSTGWSVMLATNGIDWHILSAMTAPAGSQIFRTSGSWTCPQGVTRAWVKVGGGGGGGCNLYNVGNPGGGGGAGAWKEDYVAVAPGSTYTVTIGAGGAAGAGGAFSPPGGTGGSTIVAYLLTAPGGSGGTGDQYTRSDNTLVYGAGGGPGDVSGEPGCGGADIGPTQGAGGRNWTAEGYGAHCRGGTGGINTTATAGYPGIAIIMWAGNIPIP